MSYVVAYAPAAEVELRRLGPNRLRAFERGMSVLARDPYGHGSAPARAGYEDCRDATVADVVIRYEVSKSVLRITVVRAAPSPF
ncbi:type II toxin-antitoxin system RelE/ParE family toxin [Embleya sp. NPDC020630]|uniref:type II toxin-antitoxin system RelE/ParE family toxin n=1 Tax=Embleya sp. NPDC020630 TaxID=3363979 RepID=UPI0037B5ECBD